MPDRIALPIRAAANGRLAVHEQDSTPDVEQCIGVILQTRTGDRWDYPGMGIDPTDFDEHIDVEQIAARITQYEVRATTTAAVDLEDQIANVLITWREAQDG